MTAIPQALAGRIQLVPAQHPVGLPRSPVGTDTTVAVPHATQHSDANDANDANDAIEAKLGITASTPTSNKLLLGTGAGASAWSDAPTVKTALGLTIGTDIQPFADVPSYNGIQFPAVQVPDGGANVLDDYEEGTWTATRTFATPGDLSAGTYSAQGGWYTKIGRVVYWGCQIQFSVQQTWTTASGNLRISGLPFTVNGSFANSNNGSGNVRGWTKANFHGLNPEAIAGQTYLEVWVAGSGQTPAKLTAAEFVSAGQFWAFLSGSYIV